MSGPEIHLLPYRVTQPAANAQSSSAQTPPPEFTDDSASIADTRKNSGNRQIESSAIIRRQSGPRSLP